MSSRDTHIFVMKPPATEGSPPTGLNFFSLTFPRVVDTAKATISVILENY